MNKYDMMIACNRKTSEEKINRAVTEIRQMLTDREKVTVPKLVKRTGLSRGFFYKNETVRKEMDRVLEQQAGMIDPKRYIGDIVMKKPNRTTGATDPRIKTRKRTIGKREH